MNKNTALTITDVDTHEKKIVQTQTNRQANKQDMSSGLDQQTPSLCRLSQHTC